MGRTQRKKAVNCGFQDHPFHAVLGQQAALAVFASGVLISGLPMDQVEEGGFAFNG